MTLHWIHTLFFVHTSGDGLTGYVGYAHTGDIMNSVVRIHIECLAYVAISFISLEACLGVECPDHMLKIH